MHFGYIHKYIKKIRGSKMDSKAVILDEYCKDFNKDINMKMYLTYYGKSLKQFKNITFIYIA